MRELVIHIIQNEIPEPPGSGNINLQIISTRSGIAYLKRFSPKYILKNRSDCWLSSDCFLEYLHILTLHYSSSLSKIIVPGYNFFPFRLYSPSDQIQFGNLENLEDFWGGRLFSEGTEDFRFAESYLLRDMLTRAGVDVLNSIEHSLTVYRDKFIFADNEQLGLVLNKGSKHRTGNRWAKDGYPQPMSEVQFLIWLELQTDMSRMISDYLSLPFPLVGE